jgi:hypothetical protein
MSAPLNPTVIRKAILKGFGTGIGVVGLSTLILIPISATMNYFVYHHPVIRLLLGLLGGAAFIFTLPILFFKEKTPYYFGLFPLVTKEPGAPAEGSFQWLFRFLNIFTEPFHMMMNTAEYEKSLDSLLLPKEGAAEDYSQHMLLGNNVTVRKEAVSEEFFEAAKDAGHVALSQWATRMKELEDSNIGQTLFVL